MRQLAHIDRLAIALLLPTWLVCFGLHVREVARTGIAMPAVFASPPAGPDAHPTVGGFHLERDRSGTGLEVGDRLLRLGEVDLRGVGAIRFDAHAVEQAGADLRAPLWIERDGQRLERELELKPFAVPWFRIPVVLGLMMIALSVRLRASPTPSNRLAFLGSTVLAIAQSPFMGGSYLQTLVAWPFFYLGNPLGIAIIARWAIGFPDSVPPEDRVSPRWAWALGLASLVPRLSYPLGGPVPSELIPIVEHVSDAAFFAGMTAIFAWNYRHAAPAGRRALRWVLYGFAVPGSTLAVLLVIPVAFPEFAQFGELLGWLGLLGIVTVAGFLFSIVRYGLFDIDRLVSSTATYSVVLVLLLGSAAAIVPGLARLADSYLGIGTQPAQLALSLLLVGLALPTYRKLRPNIDRFFFPERDALEVGTRQLLVDLADCGEPQEVWELVDVRIETLLRAERCVAFVRDEQHFAASPHEQLPDLGFAAGDPLLSHLAAHPSPVALGAQGVPQAAPETQRVFDALGTRLLIPFRRGKDLAAVICLGGKRSGDVYTQTDQALLGAIAEGASAKLRQLRDAELIEHERERSLEMLRLKEEAEQANQAKSRFLAAASHDLRQPLHALGLFVDALAEQVADDGPLHPLVDRVQRSTASLTEMFDALLDISRLDAGSVAAEVADFELASLFERLDTELGAQARAKGITLRTVVSRVVVRSDPVLFGRIVQNLLTNAIRYTESGRVLLGVRRRGAALRVEVWDTGPGIPEERQREIFQEFVQLAGDERKGGLGLGLSIVDRLVRLLGHSLELRSVPGRGSMFAVTTLRGEALAPSAEAPRQSGHDLEGRTILVLDDEPDILAGMQRLLERWGCRVLLATSTAEALALVAAARKPPDAVLADYRLEGDETGIEAVAALRDAWGAGLPAAIVTGEASASPLERIRATGLPVIKKPARPAKLRAVLTQLLRESGTESGAESGLS